MSPTPSCPVCSSPLAGSGGTFRCSEGHRFSTVALALATNVAAVRALWLAIRALEDDAAGLDHPASTSGSPANRQARLDEASAARAAALTLREHAQWAQNRLDALPDLAGPLVAGHSQHQQPAQNWPSAGAQHRAAGHRREQQHGEVGHLVRLHAESRRDGDAERSRVLAR